jgi:molecular chaperone DnaJ
VDAKIPFYKAILGGRIRIPTVDGDIDLKVPPGSQSEDNIALRGHGIQHLRNTVRGDQIVTLKVEFPRSLRGRQKEIIEEYASLVDDDYKPRGQSVKKSNPSPNISPPSKMSSEDRNEENKKHGK